MGCRRLSCRRPPRETTPCTTLLSGGWGGASELLIPCFYSGKLRPGGMEPTLTSLSVSDCSVLYSGPRFLSTGDTSSRGIHALEGLGLKLRLHPSPPIKALVMANGPLLFPYTGLEPVSCLLGAGREEGRGRSLKSGFQETESKDEWGGVSGRGGASTGTCLLSLMGVLTNSVFFIMVLTKRTFCTQVLRRTRHTHPQAFCPSTKSQWAQGPLTHHRSGPGLSQPPGSLSLSWGSQTLGAL